jgi:hypothetical protein
MMLVLGLAATVFAGEAKGKNSDISISGELRTRGYSNTNLTDYTDKTDDTKAAYDQRFRLGIEGKINDSVTGVLLLQTGGGASDSYTWGNMNTMPTNGIAAVEAYIHYKFGGQYGLKVGHMPLVLGNKIFFDNTKFGDDAIVLYMDPSKELHVGVLTIKGADAGTIKNNNDTDAYVGVVTYKTPAFNASADLVYLADMDPTGANNDMNLMNIGIRGDTKVGPAMIKADIEFQSGTVNKGNSMAEDMKISGTAIMVGATMDLSGLAAGIEFGMGSGDKDATDSKSESFNTSINPTVTYTTFVYDFSVKGACGATGKGICGTTYVKLSGAKKISDKMAADASLIWLKATTVASGAKDDLGIEVDANFSYQLDKNLKYWVELGYFMMGDAYMVGTVSPDAAYMLRHGLMLTF